ncbi:zinc finger BED domain-containing protein RICESLEEPER 2-like [Olea europaea var. sylvestris]|uniref:zinc finger BED domain-containing protein RICESLEEPER 2-like n=1 Tax=Olea europaea var. sylvestris TaxID=158386 RepID=UPI000C1D75C1|nr:zinc finger BED domain-containing protein RICESLEEPER 2-like [Olea europaea var. sylvestris]
MGDKKQPNERSEIWNHFTKILGGERAKCNYCGKTFKADTNSGTSSMWKHLKICYAYKNTKIDENQPLLTRENNDGGIMPTVFNKEMCRKALVKMIIIHELAFSFVEGVDFKEFVRQLCPKFDVPSRRTITRDVLHLYHETKESLRIKFIKGGQRISLTTDCWTSIQNINYMVVTEHFIDRAWKLHKRILSFSVVPNHKGKTIGKIIETCLLDWGIECVGTITVDNANTNDAAIVYVRNKLKNWKPDDTMILDGSYLHVRCSAHIINLIVKEGLKEFNPSIDSIRNAVKYFRSSPSRLTKFKCCIEREKIACTKLAILDVPTRWNSTFLMLDSALNFEKAFERMEEEDGFYCKYFDENEGGKEKEGPPTSYDWEKARKFVKFLRTFYDVTLKFSASLSVTSNIYFHEVYKIEQILKKMGEKQDYLLSSIANSMKIKFDKYWGKVDKMNKILIIAVMLDPRYKLEFVVHCIGILYDSVKVEATKNEVIKLLYALYNQQKGWQRSNNGPSGSGSGGDESNDGVTLLEDLNDDDDWDDCNFDFGYKKLKTTKMDFSGKDEVQRYLMESTEDASDENFDILNWWKINKSRFEILFEVARDVLAIPVSTVASESAFSTGGRILDPFRSSLTPKTVEALICTQNWLREESRLLKVSQDRVCIEETEFYESIETEFLNSEYDKSSN